MIFILLIMASPSCRLKNGAEWEVHGIKAIVLIPGKDPVVIPHTVMLDFLPLFAHF